MYIPPSFKETDVLTFRFLFSFKLQDFSFTTKTDLTDVVLYKNQGLPRQASFCLPVNNSTIHVTQQPVYIETKALKMKIYTSDKTLVKYQKLASMLQKKEKKKKKGYFKTSPSFPYLLLKEIKEHNQFCFGRWINRTP